MFKGSRIVHRRSAAVLLAAVAGIALAGCSLLPGNIIDTNPPGVEIDSLRLVVGDCLNGDVEGEVNSVFLVDCSEPHEQEAFKSLTMNDGEYPGEDAVLSQAITECLPEFESFIDMKYDDSILDYSALYPLAESWAEGDREILCLVFDPTSKTTTGSLTGAAR